MQPMHPDDTPTQVVSTALDVAERPTVRRPVAIPGPLVVRRERVTQLARWFVAGIILVNLFGVATIWGTNAYSISRHATRDLASHLATMQAILQRPDVLAPANLAQLQNEMSAAAGDLGALDSIIPLHGVIGSQQIRRLHHGLLMSRDFLQATQSLLDSILIIEPHLQTLLVSEVNRAELTQQDTPLTLDEIHLAQHQLNMGNTFWQAAQHERQLTGMRPINGALGIQAAGVNAIANYIATFSDRFALAFSTVSAVLDNLHVLLGVVRPSHLLLALSDPDQLLPSGGAVGAYADVEVINSSVTGGTQFQDISHLDCPRTCANNFIPPQYAWYTPPHGTWGMRDGGLDPDFHQSGTLLHDLYFAETGISVDGILMFTPAMLQHILQIIGPVVVPDLHITVSAKNLIARMDQEHQKALVLGQTQQTASAAIPTYDELFANSIFSALAHATDDQLHQIGTDLLHDLLTKDLQLYTVYGRVETQLQAVGADGGLNTPTDDSLSVIDTNLGQDYTSASVTERVEDHITLAPAGMAKHALTVTYAYPAATQLATPGGPFDDLVQVVVPAQARTTSIIGSCKKVAVTLAGTTDLACKLHVDPGAQLSLHFSWLTPVPTHSHQYRLLVQRQAGASQNYVITVSATKGSRLVTTSLGARVVNGTVTWTRAPLLSDAELRVEER